MVKLRAKQGKVKCAGSRAPAREISFVCLVAYVPKVSDSALALGGLQLLKPDRVVPKISAQFSEVFFQTVKSFITG